MTLAPYTQRSTMLPTLDTTLLDRVFGTTPHTHLQGSASATPRPSGLMGSGDTHQVSEYGWGQPCIGTATHGRHGRRPFGAAGAMAITPEPNLGLHPPAPQDRVNKLTCIVDRSNRKGPPCIHKEDEVLVWMVRLYVCQRGTSTKVLSLPTVARTTQGAAW